MDNQTPSVDADSRGARTSRAEFEVALREATVSKQSHGLGPQTALIPDLRRALRARATREEFDQGLRGLREEGIVGLAPHAHPELLRPQEVQDALSEGESVLYLLRWLR